MRRKKGFTITETVVTLLILSIFLVLTMNVGSNTVKRASFVSAFNTFVADYYWAQSRAARENRFVAIDFDVPNQVYRIKMQDNFIMTQMGTMDMNTVLKVVKPLEYEPFFDGAGVKSFAISPQGDIYLFPMMVGGEPTNVDLTFFKKDLETGNYAYKKILRLYPSGGVKIEIENVK